MEEDIKPSAEIIKELSSFLKKYENPQAIVDEVMMGKNANQVMTSEDRLFFQKNIEDFSQEEIELVKRYKKIIGDVNDMVGEL